MLLFISHVFICFYHIHVVVWSCFVKCSWGEYHPPSGLSHFAFKLWPLENLAAYSSRTSGRSYAPEADDSVCALLRCSTTPAFSRSTTPWLRGTAIRMCSCSLSESFSWGRWPWAASLDRPSSRVGFDRICPPSLRIRLLWRLSSRLRVITTRLYPQPNGHGIF